MLDLINSQFVVLAILAAYTDLIQMTRDGRLSGVRLTTAALLTVWPMWDLYYYASLGQTLSMVACLALAGLRTAWFVLALRGAQP